MDQARSIRRGGGLAAGAGPGGDVAGAGDRRGPADRRELRGAAGADGDGGAQPGAGLGAAPPPAGYGAASPNYFLVEPPLYEFGVVALRRATGLGLEESGRVLSAIATAVAGWGLFELMRRRAGRRAAILAAGAFAAFPLTIRYGRAFQPDAAMLGAVVAGLACWDRSQSAGRPAGVGAGSPGLVVAGPGLGDQDHRRAVG